MTLQQLQYFKVMANLLHYTKAATILHISQPSLSYSLSQLENELGVALFKKVGKKVFLTPIGIQFKMTTDIVLDELERGIDKIKSINKATKSEIKVGYVQSLSSTFIPRIIEEFYKASLNHDIQFIFSSNQQHNLVASLNANDLDVIFSTQLVDGLNCRHVATQELVLIASKAHQFSTRTAISFTELSSQPMIMLQPKTGLYKTIQEIFKHNNLDLNIVQEACDFSAAINYVAFDKGLSILPQTVAIENPKVRIITISDYRLSRAIYLLWKDDIKKIHKINFVNFLNDIYNC